MQAVRALSRAAVVASLFYGGALSAEALPYDHMHLAADNREAALEWYVDHLDAKMHPRGDRVTIGDVLIVFFERAGSPRSEGSAVDHFGVSFPDLEAKMREFEADGVKVLAPIRDVPGLFKLAFIEDPWGTKIEVVEDPETLGFHHVHVNVPDPQATFDWYAKYLGGVPGNLKGRIEGLRFGKVWFLARQVENAPPSRGRAIDHLGWLITDIERRFEEYEQAGLTILTPPREIAGNVAGVLDDGNGIMIDLVQRVQ